MPLFRALLSTSLLCSGILEAQDNRAIIRTEARTVLVDAVATDKKGNFARDLTAKDFHIQEDGKDQKISGFSLESAGITAERPGKHYIVLVFDSTATSQALQLEARREAIRFVEGFATPDRYMAVVDCSANGALRITQNFTTDRERLTKALSESLAVAASAQFRLAAFRDMLDSLKSLADSLASVRGRKALVFFNGGMPSSTDIESDLNAVVAASNKANVAIYTVGAGTVAGAAADNRAASSQRVTMAADDQNLAATLAEKTGGSSFRTTRGLTETLGKIAQEQDEYYLLTYTPTVDAPEGSCHTLRVKVDRGDLDVRARKGYCTSKAEDRFSDKAVDLEARAGASGAGNIAAAMQLPWFHAAPGVARVHLAMDITTSTLKFRKVKGKLHAELNLAAVAAKPDGSVAARLADNITFDFDSQQQVDAFLKAPYHYEHPFRIAPGDYVFRVTIAGEAAGAEAFGKVESPLHIEPWNTQVLSGSGLALSRNAQRATNLVAELDETLLEGTLPLVAKGTEVIPAGNTHFRVNEIPVVYFEAYEPLLTAANPQALPVLGVRVRVLDRATGAQRQDSGMKLAGGFMRPGNAVVPIVSPIPVNGLPPGSYLLEVALTRPEGIPVIHTADFEIVP